MWSSDWAGLLPPSHDIFLHDWRNTGGSIVQWVKNADKVYAANEDIAKDIRTIRPDVVTLWAPSTIEGNPHRGTINVLTFGMAHKIQPEKYEALKRALDSSGYDYTVSVSTAIHEGSPWDETARVADRLRDIFGTRMRVLGYLSDDALARELRDCDAVAVFYDPALRTNNTSFWAAVESSKTIITNLDGDSPSVYNNVYDIDTLKKWPDDWFLVPSGFYDGYSWSALLGVVGGVSCSR